MSDSTSSSERLSREEIEALIKRFILARVTFDVEELRAQLDYNVLLTVIGEPASIYPLVNRRFGQDAVIEFIDSFRTSFESGGSEILDMLIDGNRAVVMRKAIFVHRATGKSCPVHKCEWLRFRKGRIVEIAHFNDNDAMRKLLDEG